MLQEDWFELASQMLRNERIYNSMEGQDVVIFCDHTVHLRNEMSRSYELWLYLGTINEG